MIGLDITGNSLSLISLLTIGLANTFALVATFAFNDAEDAPDDMLARSVRNVIALGNASRETGYFIAATAAIISLLLSAIAGTIVVLITLAILITSFLYSWRPVRMKAKPFWDAFTHAIVGGLIFLSPAWSTQKGIIWENHVITACLIFSLSVVLAVLNHELYEYEDDLKTNTRTTVVALGKRKAYWIVGCISLLLLSSDINFVIPHCWKLFNVNTNNVIPQASCFCIKTYDPVGYKSWRGFGYYHVVHQRID
jgi:4-hydroxybenzoate polyprenyltransferase